MRKRLDNFVRKIRKIVEKHINDNNITIIKRNIIKQKSVNKIIIEYNSFSNTDKKKPK